MAQAINKLIRRSKGGWITASFLLALALCSQAFAAPVSYTYDALNRITQVNYNNGQQIITYTYDAAGNILTRNATVTIGITVTPTSGLTTTEGGGIDTFGVVLDSQPTADVTIGLSSSDISEGTVSAASLIFTAANWNTPQTVTVTGVDDGAADGNQAYSILTAAATSSDAVYSGIDPSDVTGTNLDNDSAVNNTGDTGDANPGDGICADGSGNCTLRAAIEEANALAGGNDISLPAGTYTLTGGALSVTDAVNIVGSSTTATIIDGGGTDRVFDITPAANGVTLRWLTIQNGSTTGSGGGIRNQGTLSLSACTITGNRADVNGGGIDNDTGTLSVTNCTLSGNSADNHGGGIHTTGTVNLNNVTIANNGADADSDTNGDGGGIYNNGGTVNLKNTILGDNADPNGDPDCFGNLNSEGYNLIEQLSANCSIGGDTTGNVTGQDPKLGLLADNGGPIWTHALQVGSPALDAGNPATPGSGGNACATDDQRGVTRPVGAVCDIGAFESSSPTCDIQMSQTTYTAGDTVTATVYRFANPGPDPVPVEAKGWIGIPSGPPVSALNVGADGSISLPAGFDQDFGPVVLFPASGMPTGAYEFSCRLRDPVTGALLAEDLNPFALQ